MKPNTTTNTSSKSTSSAHPSEFKQDGKKFLTLGGPKSVFVVPDIFRGEVKVNIREYFQIPTNDKFIPTKRGVCLTSEQFDNLCSQLEKTKEVVKELCKKIKKEKASREAETEEEEEEEEEEERPRKKQRKNRK